MKKLLVVLLVCVLASFLLVGCCPTVPDVEDPVSVLSAEVYGVVWNEQGDVCCYIKNTGNVDIKFYELTFDVSLLNHKPIEPVVVLGEDLDVGDTAKVCIEFMCPVCEDTDVVSVNVTYELWQ